MRHLNKYALYDMRSGERVFTGTSKECADFCGGSVPGFDSAFAHSRSCSYKGYKIQLVRSAPEKELGEPEQDAAAAWDAFVTPIREYYGIPVYKPEKGVRR